MIELPTAFADRMKALLGEEYGAFCDALCNEENVKGLRVNSHKLNIADFEENAPFELERISYVNGGYIVSDEAQAGKHPYHHAGVYYMQDPGAMSAVAAVPKDFWNGENLRVLDLCAAPGGKTTQLAALCADRGGVVLSNEYVGTRSKILSGNVERMGLSNVVVTNLDSKYIAEWYLDFFDLVVVDAPCSGEGMYRKNDNAISEWSLENVEMCAVRQKEIIENAAKNISPGGYLLYSTCTYSTEENECVVADFLDTHPEFSLCECDKAVAEHTADGIDVTGGKRPELARCRRFYPHVCKGEGQFVALLVRDENTVANSLTVKDSFTAPDKNDRMAAETFMRETVGQVLDGLCKVGGNLALFEAHGKLPLPPFGIVSVGVTLGEARKGRIIPHHHYFTAYGGGFVSKYCAEPDSKAVLRYISGEEIEVPTECVGYTALLLKAGSQSVTLGGGKASGGRLKNYYPKGLRQLNLYRGG